MVTTGRTGDTPFITEIQGDRGTVQGLQGCAVGDITRQGPSGPVQREVRGSRWLPGASCSDEEGDKYHQARKNGKERDFFGLFHRLHADRWDAEGNKKTFDYKIIRNYCFQNRNPGRFHVYITSGGCIEKVPEKTSYGGQGLDVPGLPTGSKRLCKPFSFGKIQIVFMQTTESERLLLIQKKEEVCQLSLEILDIIHQEKTTGGDVIEVKKRMVQILSLLHILASYGSPSRDLDELMKLVVRFYLFQSKARDDIVLGIPIGELFCIAVNSIEFSYGLFPTIIKSQIPPFDILTKK